MDVSCRLAHVGFTARRVLLIPKGFVQSWGSVVAWASIVMALVVAVGPLVSPCQADDAGRVRESLKGRDGTKWVVPVASEGETRIPRVCASLRDAYFEGKPESKVIVHPEIEYWEIRFQGTPASANVVLEFDEFPSTLEEAKRTEQAGDGTLTLRCSQGRVTGEKLRFEPQPHKNTIGYWAVASDTVTWPVTISKSGRFNVGLLQGAGERGGGIAKVSVLQRDQVVDSFEYKVQKTGHFQNFEWNHAGVLEIPTPGDYDIRIEAAKIDQVALMDVRQVHLSPLPNAKK